MTGRLVRMGYKAQFETTGKSTSSKRVECGSKVVQVSQ